MFHVISSLPIPERDREIVCVHWVCVYDYLLPVCAYTGGVLLSYSLFYCHTILLTFNSLCIHCFPVCCTVSLLSYYRIIFLHLFYFLLCTLHHLFLPNSKSILSMYLKAILILTSISFTSFTTLLKCHRLDTLPVLKAIDLIQPCWRQSNHHLTRAAAWPGLFQGCHNREYFLFLSKA